MDMMDRMIKSNHSYNMIYQITAIFTLLIITVYKLYSRYLLCILTYVYNNICVY